MNITRETIKETIKTVMGEEADYKAFFKKALEKAGKSIPSMSDEEKKEFFNKIDTAWDAKGEKNEALKGDQHKLDVDGDGDIEADDLADLRAGKKAEDEIDEKKNPGLWANIRAKRARGEKPAHGNSQAHKDAVKAAKKINKEESVNEGYGEFIKAKNLTDIVNLSKKKKNAVFYVTDDNNSRIGTFYLKNGKFAKATSANPNYDFQNNKTKLRDRSDVIYKYKVDESVVTEAASRTAMEIGGLTGMNKDAIQKFVDDNKLDIEKVFQFVKKGKLKDRMSLVSAIAGKPNNPVQKKMVKMFAESVGCGCGCGTCTTPVNEARLGKVSLLRGVEKGDSSHVEGVKISPSLAFELRMFLERPMLAKTRTGIAINQAQMKDAIGMLAKVGVEKRLSSGVRKEFSNLLKKYNK